MGGGQDPVVRDALADDAAAIVDVHISSWQEAYEGQLPREFLDGLPASRDRRLQFWRGVADEPESGSCLLVAEIDGLIVGFSHAGHSRDDDADASTAELGAIYVRQQWWDKSVGRALHSETIECLRRSGYSSVTLWVLDTNERARTFYERMGWALDGSEKADQIGTASVREVRYRLEL